MSREQTLYQTIFKTVEKKPAVAEMASKFSGAKILLVDDDISYCKIIKRVSEKNHLDVTYCQSIEDFKSLSHHRFDVAIMDYNLGINSPANGVELASYVQSMWYNVPIVLVSSVDRTGGSFFARGMIKKFVNKAEGPDLLISTIYDLVGQNRI